MKQTNNYVIRESLSDLGKEVFDRLQKIWNQEDFLYCSMVFLDTDEKLQKMLNFLIETGTTDSNEVIPYTAKICKGLV